MSTHIVAEAKNHLPTLIDQALAGESVVIMRHGHPVVELPAFAAAPRPVSLADIAWLDAHRVGAQPAAEDSGVTTRRIRDEDWR